MYCLNENGNIENFKLIENFSDAAADPTQTWVIHHRKETEEGKSKQQLIDEGLYFNRPPEELIFLTRAKHNELHSLVERMHTKAAREKISNSLKGRKLSEEHKLRISEGTKAAMTEEVRGKISKSLEGNSFAKGKHWKCKPRTKPAWNKGKKLSEEHKAKLRGPKSEEHKAKMAAARKGKVWANDGSHNKIFSPDAVPEGWILGMIKIKHLSGACQAT